MKISINLKVIATAPLMLLAFFIRGQDVNIGLEIDSSYSVLFGAPLNGDGNRMVWHPNKSALLVGDPFNPQFWSLDSLGAHSTAFGTGNVPAGEHTLTWGYQNWIEQGNENNFITIFGFRNNAYRNAGYSFIGGTRNEVEGFKSFVYGDRNIVGPNVDASTTFGTDNQIKGSNTHVWGIDNIVNSDLTTVMGASNVSNGFGSVALGGGLITKGAFSTIVGIYNDTTLQFDGNQAFLPTSETPLFVVGNGRDTEAGVERSNALSVFASGFVKIGRDTAVADLHIKQSTSTDALGTGGIRLENSDDSDYWQIYSSGTKLSFGRLGQQVAYIDVDGSYIDNTMLIRPNDQDISYTKSHKAIDLSAIKLHQWTTEKGTHKLKLDGESLLTYLPEVIKYSKTNNEPLIDKDQLILIMLSKLIEQEQTIDHQSIEIINIQKMIEKLNKQLKK